MNLFSIVFNKWYYNGLSVSSLSVIIMSNKIPKLSGFDDDDENI